MYVCMCMYMCRSTILYTRTERINWYTEKVSKFHGQVYTSVYVCVCVRVCVCVCTCAGAQYFIQVLNAWIDTVQKSVSFMDRYTPLCMYMCVCVCMYLYVQERNTLYKYWTHELIQCRSQSVSWIGIHVCVCIYVCIDVCACMCICRRAMLCTQCMYVCM